MTNIKKKTGTVKLDLIKNKSTHDAQEKLNDAVLERTRLETELESKKKIPKERLDQIRAEYIGINTARQDAAALNDLVKLQDEWDTQTKELAKVEAQLNTKNTQKQQREYMEKSMEVESARVVLKNAKDLASIEQEKRELLKKIAEQQAIIDNGIDAEDFIKLKHATDEMQFFKNQLDLLEKKTQNVTSIKDTVFKYATTPYSPIPINSDAPMNDRLYFENKWDDFQNFWNSMGTITSAQIYDFIEGFVTELNAKNNQRLSEVFQARLEKLDDEYEKIKNREDQDPNSQ
jgi:hypothetical protein